MLSPGLAKAIYVQFQTNVGSLVADIGKGGRAVREFGKDVQRASTESKQLYTTVGRASTVIGVGLAAALIAGGTAAIGFERRLTNVATISTHVRENMGETADTVLDMSRDLGLGANDLAEGLYDVASSGFAGADGLRVLEAAGTGARAGLSTTATAARALTAVLNAYGMTADQVEDVNDVLFQTVNLGVVTFDELANTVGDFVGTAAQANVPIDEASAALATMTLSGVSAAESGTSLNRVLQTLIKPGEDLAGTLKELGYESGVAALDTLGLKGTIDLLRESTGGQIEELLRLFPEIRAARGALALMAGEGENYNRVFAGVADETARAEAAQRALEIQSQSLGFQIDQAKASAGAMAIEFGQALLPILRPLVGFVTDLANAFSELPAPMQTTLAITSLLVASVALLGGAYLMAAPKIAALRTQLATLATTAPRVAGAIGVVQAAMGPLMLAVTAATVIWTLHTAQEKKAAEQKRDLLEAIEAERKGVEDSSEAWVVDQLVKSGAADAAKRLGLSMDDMVGSILGNEEAAERLRVALSNVINSEEMQRDIDKSTDFFGSQSRRMQDLKKLTGSFASTASGNTGVRDLENLGGELGKLEDQYAKATAEADKNRQKELEKKEVIDKTNAATGEQRKQLAQLGQQSRATAEEADKLTDAQKALEKALADFVDQGAAAKASVRGLSDAAEDAFGSFNVKGKGSLRSVASELHKSVDEALRWERDFVTVQRRAGRDVALAIRDMGEDGVGLMHAMATGSQREVDKITDEFRRLPDEAAQSLEEFTAVLEEQVADQAAWAANLAKLAEAGRGDLALKLAELGPDGASIVAEAARQIGDKHGEVLLERLTVAYRDAIPASGRELETQLLVMQEIGRTRGQATAEAIAESIGRTATEVRAALDELKPAIERLPANTVLRLEMQGVADAERELRRFRQQVEQSGGSYTVTVRQPSGGRARADATFAYGGARLPSDARIERGPTLVQWAEPETEGESFIPWARAKRPGAERILRATAEHFGLRVVAAADGMATRALPTYTTAADVLSALIQRLEQEARDRAQRQADAYNRSIDARAGKDGKIGGKDASDLYKDADAFYVKPRVDIATFQRDLGKAVAEQEKWRKNLATIARRTGQDVADALEAMGEEGVPLVAKFARASGAELDRLMKQLRRIAPETKTALEAFADNLDAGVKEQQAFEKNLVALVKGGHAELAAYLSDLGVDEGGAIAAQAVKATASDLRAIEKDLAAGKTLGGDKLTGALQLIGILTGSRDVGLRALAAASGMDIPAVLMLLEAQKALFAKVPAANMAALKADLNAIMRGEQPRSYADGGIEWHAAQVAYSPRRWAEPETEGEAYLPLARSKRARTLSLMGTLAESFGYRMAPIGAGGGGVVIQAGAFRVDVDARGAADPAAVQAAVEDGLENAFAELLDRLGAGSGTR